MVDQSKMHEVEVNIDVQVSMEADFPEREFLPIRSIEELKVGDILVNLPTCEVHKVTEIRDGEIPVIVMLDSSLDIPFPVVQQVLSRAVLVAR